MPDQISIILSLQRAYQHLIQIESSSMGLEGGGGETTLLYGIRYIRICTHASSGRQSVMLISRSRRLYILATSFGYLAELPCWGYLVKRESGHR